MAFPFRKIKEDEQEDHIVLGEDVANLKALIESQDPRIVEYCKVLRRHKRNCPICSAPRLYWFGRVMKRKLRAIFLRKVF